LWSLVTALHKESYWKLFSADLHIATITLCSRELRIVNCELRP
jgi:hypothetical protein